MYERFIFIEIKLRRISLKFVFVAPNFPHETALLITKATVRFTSMTKVKFEEKY